MPSPALYNKPRFLLDDITVYTVAECRVRVLAFKFKGFLCVTDHVEDGVPLSYLLSHYPGSYW